MPTKRLVQLVVSVRDQISLGLNYIPDEIFFKLLGQQFLPGKWYALLKESLILKFEGNLRWWPFGKETCIRGHQDHERAMKTHNLCWRRIGSHLRPKHRFGPPTR